MKGTEKQTEKQTERAHLQDLSVQSGLLSRVILRSFRAVRAAVAPSGRHFTTTFLPRCMYTPLRVGLLMRWPLIL